MKQETAKRVSVCIKFDREVWARVKHVLTENFRKNEGDQTITDYLETAAIQRLERENAQ